MPKTTDYQICRAEDKKDAVDIGGFKIEPLTSSDIMEHLLVTIQPGVQTQTFQHHGEEITIILEGELDIILDGTAHHLEKNDSIWHNSSVPHQWVNASDKVTRVSTVASPCSYSKLVRESQKDKKE